MNLDKHEVLALISAPAEPCIFCVKKHLAQQEVLGVNSTETKILLCDMYIIFISLQS